MTPSSPDKILQHHHISSDASEEDFITSPPMIKRKHVPRRFQVICYQCTFEYIRHIKEKFPPFSWNKEGEKEQRGRTKEKKAWQRRRKRRKRRMSLKSRDQMSRFPSLQLFMEKLRTNLPHRTRKRCKLVGQHCPDLSSKTLTPRSLEKTTQCSTHWSQNLLCTSVKMNLCLLSLRAQIKSLRPLSKKVKKSQFLKLTLTWVGKRIICLEK